MPSNRSPPAPFQSFLVLSGMLAWASVMSYSAACGAGQFVCLRSPPPSLCIVPPEPQMDNVLIWSDQCLDHLSAVSSLCNASKCRPEKLRKTQKNSKKLKKTAVEPCSSLEYLYCTYKYIYNVHYEPVRGARSGRNKVSSSGRDARKQTNIPPNGRRWCPQPRSYLSIRCQIPVLGSYSPWDGPAVPL